MLTLPAAPIADARSTRLATLTPGALQLAFDFERRALLARRRRLGTGGLIVLKDVYNTSTYSLCRIPSVASFSHAARLTDAKPELQLRG
jgi:hypothetical protein